MTETGETVANAWVEWLPSGAIGLTAENMTGTNTHSSHALLPACLCIYSHNMELTTENRKVHPGDHIRVSIRVDTAHAGFVYVTAAASSLYIHRPTYLIARHMHTQLTSVPPTSPSPSPPHTGKSRTSPRLKPGPTQSSTPSTAPLPPASPSAPATAQPGSWTSGC